MSAITMGAVIMAKLCKDRGESLWALLWMAVSFVSLIASASMAFRP